MAWWQLALVAVGVLSGAAALIAIVAFVAFVVVRAVMSGGRGL